MESSRALRFDFVLTEWARAVSERDDLFVERYRDPASAAEIIVVRTAAIFSTQTIDACTMYGLPTAARCDVLREAVEQGCLALRQCELDDLIIEPSYPSDVGWDFGKDE
jgi:hypothetical protein